MNGCIQVIDVSAAQGAIDWGKVAASGISQARIKIYDGNEGPDACAVANVTCALANGIAVTPYCAAFPLPVAAGHSARDAASQVRLFVSMARMLKLDASRLYLDYEWPGVPDLPKWGQTLSGVLNWAVTAKHAAQALGMSVGTYVGQYYADAVGFCTVPDFAEDNPLWLADYRPEPHTPGPWTDWQAWQWTNLGTCPGIQTKVDLSWVRVTS